MKGHTSKDGKFHPHTKYNKIRKKIDTVQTLKKTKGVKMTSFQARPTSQFATTLKKDERIREGIRVTADWENFIRSNYPQGKWTKPKWYFRIRKNEGSDFIRAFQLERVSGIVGDESITRFHPQMIEDHKNPEVSEAWFNAIQRSGLFFEGDKSLTNDFLKKWTQAEADKQTDLYLKFGRFSDNKIVKVKDGYSISDLLSPVNQFIEDVENGKIKDKNGLKVSIAEVQGLRPEGGFVNSVLGMTFGTEQRDDAKASGFYSGLVIKISGDDDPELKDNHNVWGVITKVIDDYHYEVIPEGGNAKDSFVIRDEDVKGLVGDKETDLIGIGEERHKEEVIPLIEKAMRG